MKITTEQLTAWRLEDGRATIAVVLDEDDILEVFEYEQAMEKLVYEIRGAVFKAHDAGISGLAMREECLNALLDAISDVVEINNKENASA